jgi:recombination protein U
MYKNPYLYSIENKSKATDSLSWTLDVKTKGKDIKAQQLLSLWENYNKGLIAGLLINFRDVNETYFLHIKDFMNFAASTTKRSINRSDVKKHNGFLVPQTLKKVRYKYDIEELIKHCESTYEFYHKQIKGENNLNEKKD